MSLSKLVDLVGKAEEEGVTLAAMIRRDLTPEDLEAARLELSMELSKSRLITADYMSDVEIPTLEDILSTGFSGFPSIMLEKAKHSEEAPAEG